MWDRLPDGIGREVGGDGEHGHRDVGEGEVGMVAWEVEMVAIYKPLVRLLNSAVEITYHISNRLNDGGGGGGSDSIGSRCSVHDSISMSLQSRKTGIGVLRQRPPHFEFLLAPETKFFRH